MIRLSPIHFFKLLISLINEIGNYSFYRKTITKLDQAGVFKAKGMRVDSLKRIYYVHNMPTEALMYGTDENGDTDKFEKRFVAESMIDKKDIFVGANLFEIVKTELKRIKTPDYYAYLVWVNFRFDKLKLWNIVYLILYIIAATLLVRFSVNHWNYVTEAFAWVRSKF